VSLLLQNLSYTCRTLRRQPTFSSVAILTLALGIGATTAVFTVVYGVLFRPLPYRDPGRLGHAPVRASRQSVAVVFSAELSGLCDSERRVLGPAALTPITVNMTGLGEPERLQGARVSWNYFDVLGVGIAHGRASNRIVPKNASAAFRTGGFATTDRSARSPMQRAAPPADTLSRP
jgi:putative ABC transport system permease protein